MSEQTPLTNEELIDLYGVTFSVIHSQFELWLTITFAVIIASYIAGHKLSRLFQFLIAGLYLFVTTLLFLMFMTAVQYANQMIGTPDAMILFDSPMTRAVAILRVGIWVLGSIITVAFIFRGHRDGEL